MNFLRSAVAELIGLFVDDWAFALSVGVWVGFIALARHRLPSESLALLLFLGLAALTLVFVVRRAQRR
ncbi:MAG: hypothetical protein M3Y28_00990 [Armatimonadota bacterium]|nr:hypothetical protein [Armatimonadota bacterium]